MITCITGKPGDGKSLFSTKLIVDDLVEGNCVVATNIPLNLKEIRAYVVKRRGPAGDLVDLDKNLLLLEHAQVMEFFRFRSGGLVLAESPDANSHNTRERLPREEFNEFMKAQFLRIAEKPEYMLPVHYYIDEAHEYFSSREWATNGRGTLFYASKHRHLHDNVFLITQVIENVEKQLRGLVSVTESCRNYRRRSIGAFKMRPVFMVRSYYGLPQPSTHPFATTSFQLDVKGLAACYQTTGALGVQKTPEAAKNKGWLPWWSLPVGGAVAVLLLASLVGVIPRLLTSRLRFGNVRSGAAVVQPGAVAAAHPDPAPRAAVAAPNEEPEATEVFNGVSTDAFGNTVIYLLNRRDWVIAAPVRSSDLFAYGRNKFARPETTDEREERKKKLYAEAKTLTPQLAAEPQLNKGT